MDITMVRKRWTILVVLGLLATVVSAAPVSARSPQDAVGGQQSLEPTFAAIRDHRVTVDELVTEDATDYQPYIAGEPTAAIWMSDRVAIILENELVADRDAAHMASILTRFEQLFLTYDAVTGSVVSNQANHEGRIRIEVSSKVGGGLAGHGTFGIAVGTGFFTQLYDRTVLGDTSLEQIYYYEIARNYWTADLNPTIDYHTSAGPQDWGWWTVGFNNAMACFASVDQGIELYYFGQRNQGFCQDNMKTKLDEYVADPDLTWENSWNVPLLPWRNSTSLNDLMTGTLIDMHQRFGGTDFIARLYRAIRVQPELPNRSATAQARDNFYRAASIAAAQDLRSYFEDTLKWELSEDATAVIAATALAGFPATFDDVTAWQASSQVVISPLRARRAVAPGETALTGFAPVAAGAVHLSVVDTSGQRGFWDGERFVRARTMVEVPVLDDGSWRLDGVDLSPGQKYRVRVHAVDQNGTPIADAVIARYAFTTAGSSSDPVVRHRAPGRRVVAGPTDISGVVTDAEGVRRMHVMIVDVTDRDRRFWNGSSFQDEAVRVRVRIAPDGTWSVEDVDLESGRRYRVKVRAVDVLGNVTRPTEVAGKVIRAV